MGMDVDGARIVRGDDEPEGGAMLEDGDGAEKHMHPVAHRALVPPLQTAGLPLGTPSTAGTSCTDEEYLPAQDVPMQIALPPPSTPPPPPPSLPTSSPASPPTTSTSTSTPPPAALDAQTTSTSGSAQAPGTAQATREKNHAAAAAADAGPTLLTCTFRARDLLRKVTGGERPPLKHAAPLPLPVAGNIATGNTPHITLNASNNAGDGADNDASNDEDEDGWEFCPARVPDGISLRNFGIQVPIYATLSDIVVYSPAGLASRSLHTLAHRMLSAVRRKRAERCRVLGIDPEAQTPDAPLEYNVFVLDADARTLRAAVPELMMRVFEGGERRLSAGPLSAQGPEGEDDMLVDVSVSGVEAEDGMQVDAPDAPDPHAHASAHADAAAHAHVAVPVAAPIDPDADVATTPNTVDFGQRERDEMRELTRASEILSVFGGGGRYPFANAAGAEEDERGREDLSNTTTASHWRPAVGQVFLGNSGDVPLGATEGGGDPFDYVGTNAPGEGMGYDVCVECHEMAPFPSLTHLRAAEEHLTMLDAMWDERVRAAGEGGEGPVRPPPNANAVIHLPFPSAPSNTAQTMNALLPVVAFLERCLRPVPPRASQNTSSNDSAGKNANAVTSTPTSGSGTRRWSTFPTAVSPAAFFPSPPAPPGTAPRTRSLTSPAPSPAPTPAPPPRTRPLKILIYSSDGYTESSPLALTLLMAVRRLSLPEAYLELQVAKRRSFFVYPGELGLLRRIEARIGGGEVFAPARMGRRMSGAGTGVGSTGSLGSASGAQMMGEAVSTPPVPTPSPSYTGARPSAKSVSFAPGAVVSPPVVVPSQGSATRAGRPRARTSPWLPSFGDHQSWFNDPRFDGSFPSRVLPFLYLGNLNHASNAYMLHALGITHVVSVGECALVPPPGHCIAPGETCTSAACRANHNKNAHFIQGKGPGNQGSLWIEEREGRIKVLDIQGVCDDGIDTLEPQLEPICEWIEKARQDGGQVLVHCRVGVSRSATVTIAYVMKHLSLPLVDAYLIVRSRRLSVLIQPNMRLLYNLCGWEIKLAKERAGDDARQLRKELARTLTWPYLSKEVHALNEKYLH
ncbi:hypothetical protein B0H11DRAFT_1997229 [Mycena galericulata]|nr:hypothetical protein B0H11DRAFT_1997229 [Mycena galericulata]